MWNTVCSLVLMVASPYSAFFSINFKIIIIGQAGTDFFGFLPYFKINIYVPQILENHDKEEGIWIKRGW